jgi:REP element-mobilizing transposase RayT
MRTARSLAPGEVFHVISRFVEERFFINTDDERSYYLRLLGNALAKTDWVCLAYALMSNHIHLAMVCGVQPAASWSRRVNPPYVNWYNELHDRVGPLFASRAKMSVARPENVGALIAYIHNNPVRARVVRRAVNSSWTSHRAYVGRVAAPSWLGHARGLELTGIAVNEFDDWVHARRTMKRDDPSLKEIDREAKRLGAIVLGTPKLAPLEVPLLARRTAHIRPTPGRIVEVVQETLGLERGEIFDLRRGSPGPSARAVAIQIGMRFGVPMSATGDALGIRKSAAARLGAVALDEANAQLVELIYVRLVREVRT